MERVRKVVQALWVFLTNGFWGFPFTGTLYQGPLKVLCSPGLNCYSCPAATAFCPIGSLQQLLLGVRLSLQSGQLLVGTYVLGCLGLLGTVFGRFICGWACPFGLLQELLHAIPTRKYRLPPVLRFGKYLCLVLQGRLPDRHARGRHPMLLLMPELRTLTGWLFAGKLAVLTAVLLWSVPVSRPFCRTLCPLGVFYGLFNRVSLIRLKFSADACTTCGACHAVCPVGIRFNETPESSECIRCLRCLTQACEFNAISLDLAGLTLSGGPTLPEKNSPRTTAP